MTSSSSRRGRASAVAFACAVLGACAAESIGTDRDELISDQVHNQGTAGFYFLAPLVPAPHPTGTFEGRLAPVVQIDRVDPTTGAVLAPVVTFDSEHRVGGAKIRVQRSRGYYLVRWRTDDYDLSPSATYRINVLVDGHRLGFADVDVVRTSRELRNVNTNDFVPLKLDSTLAIKFRIETQAVDQDGDGVLDWRDNCPAVANGRGPVPGYGAPHQPPADCDHDWHECDDDEGDCDHDDHHGGGTGGGQLDTDGDGTGDACEACPLDPAKTEPGACGCGNADGGPNCPLLCATETFEAQGCNTALGTSFPVFGGQATLTRTAGGSALASFLPQNEDCELNIGACTTFSVDATHPILFAVDSVYEMTIDFARPTETFTVGKLYGSSRLSVTFKRAGVVVAADVVNRAGADCNTGDTRTWSVPGGFDQVLFNGAVFGLTDLEACHRAP